jgi:hypothetical protein
MTDQDLLDVFSEAEKVDSSQIIIDRATNGLPDEVAKFPDPYAGMEKLDFAKDAPDFMEAIRELSK